MSRSKTACRAAYSAAATAAFLSSDASAVVVYSGAQDLSIDQGNLQNLNLDNDAYGDIQLKNYVFTQGNYQGATVTYTPGKIVGFTDLLKYVSALDADAPIDATTAGPEFLGSMAYGPFNPYAQFNDVQDAYIGLAFPTGERLHYGWVRVTINNAAGTFVINDWAFESKSGVGILAGEIGAGVNPGDFNNDGVVDAADYTLYRDNIGQNPDFHDNDDYEGDSAGVVDQADYELWAIRHGAFGPVVSTAAGAAPEPGTLGLLAAGSLGLMALRRSKGHA
ncbi:hypothetical protein Pla123a_25440 [Posidoniimonas polymericola]|uniref:Ice-binding protein C-terminal domain-containing protein n=1 Tax=Posidoniimonas polymericola TaxID=2528002 RepID=A0A5C5YQA6_9BACT|nr:PEP-CTERM sorting domain-containing protein [Posidoniimonas polymericola]TWT77114.1 hypothetical protein Pla123a_25440 [Posidoniimonas polymericola]